MQLPDNVVSLWAYARDRDPPAESAPPISDDLAISIERNQLNQARIARERAASNASVLRSFRIQRRPSGA